MTISHDMASVHRIADKVAMIHNGVIIWCGPVAEIDETGVPEVDQFVHGRAEGPLTTAAKKRHGADNGKNQRVSFVCQECGGTHRKWSGRCDHCGAWNTIAEEREEAAAGPGKRATGRRIDMQPLAMNANTKPLQRMVTGIAEFDRVSGGGLVPGSASLIGGDPGIGKSTLLLQLVCQLATAGVRTAYISGEESADQVRMQAETSRSW